MRMISADFETSPNVAVSESNWIRTGVVVNVKDAAVAPAGTVTVADSFIALLSSDKLIARPPTGAGLDSVTVPTPGKPPIIIKEGISVSEVREGGFTVSVAGFVLLPMDAVMDGVAIAPTAFVVTGKVTEVSPAGTVTLIGTVAAAVLLLDNVTVAPPAGAGAVRVTVPVEETPPVTLVGFNVADARLMGGVGTKKTSRK
jgi:hypothetical protein